MTLCGTSNLTSQDDAKFLWNTLERPDSRALPGNSITDTPTDWTPQYLTEGSQCSAARSRAPSSPPGETGCLCSKNQRCVGLLMAPGHFHPLGAPWRISWGKNGRYNHKNCFVVNVRQYSRE